MKRMFITLATVVILSITLTAQSQSLPEANQIEIAAQENNVATSDSAYRSIPIDSIAVIETNVDTVAKVVEIPLDTIIAQNIRRIKDSLPKYKPNKFSETMLRLPLIMSDYQPTRTTSLEEEIKRDYATSRLRCAIPNEKEPIDEQINQLDICKNYYFYSNIRYDYIINHPNKNVVLAWTLPEFKKLEDVKLKEITDIPTNIEPEITIQVIEIKKTHWLHVLDGSVQFSQAYLSPNWYQGGNNNLSLLANFLWNVKLNEVYHPNLLFENNIQYKLGLYSTPQDEVHKYSISEDLFQWNMKAGVKAFKKWFYSFTAQFKTQLLNTYPQNSTTRIASFLSPSDLNLGLGMTYNTTNNSKSLKFNVSIAPISYNLKTCIDTNVDPTQFNIESGKKMTSEIGSNAELTMDWNITKNINYRSRLFLFSNYKYLTGDWENTLSFSINKFLSTQIYVHLRYDSSSELNERWKHWMLKEILSFGFQYKFSTKI